MHIINITVRGKVAVNPAQDRCESSGGSAAKQGMR